MAKKSKKKTSKGKKEKPAKAKRIALTTSISAENRAFLEAEAFRRKQKVADVLNDALDKYFKGAEQTEFYRAYLDRLKSKHDL